VFSAHLFCRKPRGEHGSHVDVEPPVDVACKVSGEKDVTCAHGAYNASDRFSAEVIPFA
jgi:hypothetical protein